MVSRLTPEQESRVWDAAARATKFFMGTADVQKALAKLVAALEGDSIPYAIVGAMALTSSATCRFEPNTSSSGNRRNSSMKSEPL